MKLTGPYLTLAGGLTVAGVLLALSMNATTNDNAKSPVAATGANIPANAEPSADASEEDSADDAEKAGDAGDESPDATKPIVEVAPSGTYAGEVKGGGASLAIAIKGDTAIAYVCDGKKVEAWVQGPVKGTLSLKGKKGAAVNAKYTDGKLVGTVKAGGKDWSFGLKTVKAPSGLYRAAANVRNAKVVGGWIIAEGRQVGMVDRDGVETPAPPIDLSTGKVTIDGTTIKATELDGSPVQ